MLNRRQVPLLVVVVLWCLFLAARWADLLPGGRPVSTIVWIGLVIVSARVIIRRFL